MGLFAVYPYRKKSLKLSTHRALCLGWLLLLCLLFLVPVSYTQVLEKDPSLEGTPRNNSNNNLPPLNPTVSSPGNFYSDPSQQRPSNASPPNTSPSPKIILKGNVTTLDTAMIQEKDLVDWYGWYMSCREYLIYSGGFRCPIGTMIRFNRNGQMTALSNDFACRVSVAQKLFPLPKQTKLDAILLPVRSAKAPPASPEELYQRLKGGD
ncbi:MAG: hypothetical protein K2X66_08075 [Cyanobacteria bacterium]|nr:hypothetical protein [Cyanobacteriota bacterium]